MKFGKIWDFWKCPGPSFQKPQTNWIFENAPLCPVLSFQKTAKKNVWKNPVLPGSKFQFLAIHKIISHIWEDGSQKVNNDEPDLRFLHGNFWPVMSQAVRKPCFSAWISRGQISGSPELVGTLPQAPFFSHEKGTHISGSPELVGTLPQAPFFPTKKGPIFLGTDHEGTARKSAASRQGRNGRVF